jgi:hypothetical protein
MSSIRSRPEHIVDDLWDRLMSLREHTASHGVLVDAQLEQLKLWGCLAFQHVPRTGIEIRVNFEEHTVLYVLQGGRLARLNVQANLVAGLDRSIHALLGDEWKLLIDHDGERVYEGRAKSRAEILNERRAARRARTGRKSPR